MLRLGSGGAQVCVVGQTGFETGSGLIGAGLAEAWARFFPVCFMPTDAVADGALGDHVVLPSGRVLPVCREPGRVLVSVVCDGVAVDAAVPGRLRYVWLELEGGTLPAGWFARVNGFDAVLVGSANAAGVARASGVTRPIQVVPFDLDGGFGAGAAGLIDPSIAAFRGGDRLEPELIALVEGRLGRRGDAVEGPRRQVCAVHDGGFYSVFNTYMSHLVWQQQEDRCHSVLPDWDVERFLGRLEAPILSFCYGQPGDGNLWAKLFLPLFGASDAEMNDPRFLWRHAELPADRHNEAREPLMTYVRAYGLYRSADFSAFRRQYHRVFRRHVRLRPELQAEVDAFAAAHLTSPILIAAHVRHPSHTVEQPTGEIAGTEVYIAAVRDAVRRRGGDPEGAGWTVFVATDQERVVRRFQTVFGARAVFFADARRTRAGEDAAFDALSPMEQRRDGHQLQHLVAADRAGWSWRMAWEVVRDATVMARCHALLHVVSNVSTAVAYMNPEIEMVFCDP